MKLLLISNSTNAGEPYLKYPMPRIDEFLGSVREVVFVPYAGITFSYAEYEAKRAGPFCGIRHQGTFRTPFERSPAYDPRGTGHLRRRRQHLRPDQENAGAGAVESHPRQDQGRHALHRLVGRQQRLLPDDLAPPTTCPSSNRNRSRLSGP